MKKLNIFCIIIGIICLLVAGYIVTDKILIKEDNKIRITNISNANDPKEGKILENIFNKNSLNIKIKNDENLITLQTSLSRNKDALTMFRLYGKNENKKQREFV